jgi:phospholipase/carboxylesterase
MMFRFFRMVPLIPDTIPDLSKKSIFVSGGSHDPIVPKRETERLVDLFKESSAKVFVYWEDSGNELGMGEITQARKWMFLYF